MTEQPMYVDAATVERTLAALRGTASQFFRIWLTLKAMGLGAGRPAVVVDTRNPEDALQYLFGGALTDGRFFIPVGRTTTEMFAKPDARRSIVQTNVNKWMDHQVTSCDPTAFLDIEQESETQKLVVRTGVNYPRGLGYGPNGFAPADGARLAVPLDALAIWLGRQTAIPQQHQNDATAWLREQALQRLHITPAERELVFDDAQTLTVTLRPTQLTTQELEALCLRQGDSTTEPRAAVLQDRDVYDRRIRMMGLSAGSAPAEAPAAALEELLADGARAILLYGPPRTGKTHLIDTFVPRRDPRRESIQVHDGWGYDRLVEGLTPQPGNTWDWVDGPLKIAIQGGKKFIVLEEISRTDFSQAIGEVFSLIETGYRGRDNALRLRSGDELWVDEDTVFLMTMNTLDKSTEDVDDALLGRVAAIECPPDAATLTSMLQAADVPAGTRERVLELFGFINERYELGHGYFVDVRGDVSDAQLHRYYRHRIRPVLQKYLGDVDRDVLQMIDQKTAELFPHWAP